MLQLISLGIAILFILAVLMGFYAQKADLRAVRGAIAVLALLTLVTQILSMLVLRADYSDKSTALERQELERVRTLTVAEKGIKSAISEMNSALRGLVGNLDKHSSQLDKHRLGVTQAATLNEIKTIETRLLMELNKIREANSGLKGRVLEMNQRILEQEAELSKLNRLSTIDPLTLIANRGAFDKRLAEEIHRVKRYQSTFSLIMVDIDHFKEVNDKYGHQNGDRLLRAFGKLLDNRTRLSDYVARFGGEEFTVILPETKLSTAIGVAEKVRTYFSRTNLHFEKQRIKLSASFGVAQYRPSDTNATILKRSDDALYLSKRSGRNKTSSELDLEESNSTNA